MSNDDLPINLFADLLKLLKKHGELSFHQLAAALRDPKLTASLTAILEEVPKRTPARKPQKPKTKQTPKKKVEPHGTSLQQWSDIILDQPKKK